MTAQPVEIRKLLVGGVVLLAAVTMLVVLWLPGSRESGQVAGGRRGHISLDEIPVDGRRAYQVLVDLCALGPRPSGSPGMLAQQKYLENYYRQRGGQVRWQRFRARHPLTGKPVTMANLLVQWHPQRKERILLCAHYDTRPFPDRDPDAAGRRGIFLGANDGASGVAVLCELAHHMAEMPGEIGVDFALFDGEELVFDDDRDPYFLGSRFFAQQYANDPPAYRYRAAVLLDMVGDKFLQIYQERHSVRWRDTRPITRDLWKTAARLGVREFIPRVGYEVRDDHVMLHDVGGIPSCDIIDFDYSIPGSGRSFWHTRQDTPDKCSPLSLAKVGWVVLEWLTQQQVSRVSASP